MQINLVLFRVDHSIIKHMAFLCSLWNSEHYSKDFSIHRIDICLHEFSDIVVKFTNSGLSFYLFYFSFLFSFGFIFLFSIFRTTRVRVDRSHCHISHNLMA